MYDLKTQVRDNLFSANHRSKMIARHGFTEAMRITLEDLLEHDCKGSEDSGCQGCLQVGKVGQPKAGHESSAEMKII